MALEGDLLVDRQHLKRRLNFWRVVSVVLLGAALTLFFALYVPASLTLPHVARLRIEGLIVEDPDLLARIDAAATDPSVKALIVEIDSPGGTVAGGEMLHVALARVAAQKPVVAVMQSIAASAGYMIALPAARIFCAPATLTGSIGVLLETGNVERLLDKLGVQAESIVSGPLKDQPSLTRPLSAEGRAVLQGLVMDMYEQFVAMVAEGRHMPIDKVKSLADGRAYTGRQALALGLVDEFGDERRAREWLAEAKEVGKDLPVEDLQKKSLIATLLASSAAPLLPAYAKYLIFKDISLDGAWAIWHP